MPLLSRLFGRPGGGARGDARAVEDFYRSLLLHVDPAPLYASVLARLSEIYRVDSLALVLLDAAHGDYRVHARRGAWPDGLDGLRWEQRAVLARWLGTNARPLSLLRDREIVADLPPAEARALAATGAELVVPLEAVNRLSGFLLAGPSDLPHGWTEERARALATLLVPAALAFEHAALVAEERDRLRRLYRAERLATAGTIAAGLAHEIRNPLAAIRVGIQMLHERDDLPGEAAEVLGASIEEVDRIERLVGGLLLFARAPRGASEPVDLGDLVRRAAALLAARARKGNATLALEVPDAPVVVNGDAGQLEQVLLNLLLNALEAQPQGGAIRLGLVTERSRAVLSVHDGGPGLPAAAGERIFDPFFTTKPEGSGLGLPISFSIVRQHGGDLSLENHPAGGAIARVVLPLATGPEARP